MLGNEWATQLLAEHVARGQVRHAYLFAGPDGIGRRTLALRLAQALNCLEPPTAGESCQTCRACKQIERMEYADLAVVQAEQHGGTLRVDQVRELQRSLALAPYEARYRVAVLLRFEEANASAMNALLKTLEEPAPQVVIVLTAESGERLLPTIVSRCEVLRLRPLPVEQVSQGLQEFWGASPEQARLLAHLSGGRPGYAFHLLKQPERLEQRLIWLDAHSRLLVADRVERFAYAEKMAKDKETLRMELLVWLAFWRDVLLQSTDAKLPVANLDRLEEIRSLAEQLGLQIAHRTVASLERTLAMLDNNINLRLVMEVLLLDLPRW